METAATDMTITLTLDHVLIGVGIVWLVVTIILALRPRSGSVHVGGGNYGVNNTGSMKGNVTVSPSGNKITDKTNDSNTYGWGFWVSLLVGIVGTVAGIVGLVR